MTIVTAPSSGAAPGEEGATDEPASPGAISWDVATRTAAWMGRRHPLTVPYRPDELQAEFDELTAQAEELVAASTGLRSPTGPARARVTDRAGWVRANVASFQRLVGPHLDRLDPARRLSRLRPPHPPADATRATDETDPIDPTDPIDGTESAEPTDPTGTSRFRPPSGLSGLSGLAGLPAAAGEQLALTIAGAGRAATGAQMGLILGWMSTRVLGQYDLLLTEDAVEDQDIVYYVGPNVVALEHQHGFDPREFRLWLALHEVTHRCQFTAVPWMRAHFVSLIDEGLGAMEPDPAKIAEAVRRMADEIRAGRNPLRDAGALGLMATPEQLEHLQKIQALMSLLEGHGDVTMDRAGAADIPSAPRFSEVLRERRNRARGPARLLRQLIGLEAKLRQYEEGERFVAAVERSGGTELFDRVWRGPEWLPSLAEIRDPAAWISRVGAAPALPG